MQSLPSSRFFLTGFLLLAIILPPILCLFCFSHISLTYFAPLLFSVSFFFNSPSRSKSISFVPFSIFRSLSVSLLPPVCFFFFLSGAACSERTAERMIFRELVNPRESSGGVDTGSEKDLSDLGRGKSKVREKTLKFNLQ